MFNLFQNAIMTVYFVIIKKNVYNVLMINIQIMDNAIAKLENMITGIIANVKIKKKIKKF